MTVCKAISMFATKYFAIAVDRTTRPSGGTRPLLVMVALAAMIAPLAGCGDGAGGTGGGTVDIASAKDKAKTNPDIAKAAAARGAGVGDAKQGKKGR
jgi:hypothetical protein